MNNDNPFRAPSASVADIPENGGLELAGRGHRFGAAMIDGLIAMLLGLPIAYAVGIIGMANFMKGQSGHSFMMSLEMGVLGFVIFILTQGYFLQKNGQTIGKKIVGIRIVDLDEKNPGIGTLLGRRYAPIFIAQIVPTIGPFLGMIDPMFIFRRDRRCIHDLIASTKVVAHNPRFSSGAWFAIPFLILIGGGILIGIAAVIIIPKTHLALPAGAKQGVTVPQSVVVPQANPVNPPTAPR